MKRIASILKDAFSIIGTVTIIGVTLLMACNASAQDIYEIEQTFGEPFNMLYINKGWDVRLIQAPTGCPTTVVLQTRCAEFFEEGTEPQVVKIEKLDKKDCCMTVEPNQSMPRSTVVEIHTTQPINEIHLYKDARLTIVHYDFDSVKLDIDLDTGAVLVIDTANNRHYTSISLTDATLDLRHITSDRLSVWAEGESIVKGNSIGTDIHNGDIRTRRYWLRLSEKSVSDIAATDSSRRVFVERKRLLNGDSRFTQLSLNFGLDVCAALQGTDDTRYGSPYNTLGEFGVYEELVTNKIPLGGRWSWHPGLQLAYHVRLLDNRVKVDGNRRLMLDNSYGAINPRQHLDHFTIGFPVTLDYTFDKKWHSFSKGFYFKLTPLFNFNQELVTQTLNENSHWVTRHDRDLDMLNRFNLRAAAGLNLGMLGFRSIEFFMDLLPTYKPTAEAPQTRMFGLVYHF